MSIFDRKKKEETGAIVPAKGKARGKPFAKGFDPRINLKGRPKTGEALAEHIRQFLNTPMQFKGTEEEISILDAGLSELAKEFAAGDPATVKLMFDRGFGKLPESIVLSQTIQEEEEGDFSLIPFEAAKLIEYWLWITEGSKPAPATIEDTKRKTREAIQKAVDDSNIIGLIKKYTGYQSSE